MKSEQEVKDQIKELERRIGIISAQHLNFPHTTLFYQTQIGILEWVLR